MWWYKCLFSNRYATIVYLVSFSYETYLYLVPITHKIFHKSLSVNNVIQIDQFVTNQYGFSFHNFYKYKFDRSMRSLLSKQCLTMPLYRIFRIRFNPKNHTPTRQILPIYRWHIICMHAHIHPYTYNFFFHHRSVKARAIACPHQPPTRGDNAVSLAQGSTITPGATKQLLLPDKVFKRIIYNIHQINWKQRLHSTFIFIFSAVCDF